MLAVDGPNHLVDGQYDSQPHRGLGGSQHDDEKGEDLPRHAARHVAVEGHQIDIGGVENQLDAHEHGHGVAAGDHGQQAKTEKQGANDQKMIEGKMCHDFRPLSIRL